VYFIEGNFVCAQIQGVETFPNDLIIRRPGSGVSGDVSLSGCILETEKQDTQKGSEEKGYNRTIFHDEY
jgi:hypothetical protein